MTYIYSNYLTDFANSVGKCFRCNFTLCKFRYPLYPHQMACWWLSSAQYLKRHLTGPKWDIDKVASTNMIFANTNASTKTILYLKTFKTLFKNLEVISSYCNWNVTKQTQCRSPWSTPTELLEIFMELKVPNTVFYLYLIIVSLCLYWTHK